MQKKFILYLFLLFALFYSCEERSVNNQQSNAKSSESYSDTSQGKSLVYLNYKLPLPYDIYKQVKRGKFKYEKEYLLSYRNEKKYFTEEKMALALGVYSSDLIYGAVYNRSQEVIEYLNVSGELAGKLDISEGYDNRMIDRASRNIDDSDSISKLAREAYWRTCNYLEKNNKTYVLPLIILGSWIESVHVLVNTSLGTKKEDGLYKEIYLQKEVVSNLTTYFSDVILKEENPQYKLSLTNWLGKLQKVQADFDLIINEDVNSIDMEKLKKIIVTLEELRSEIVMM